MDKYIVVNGCIIEDNTIYEVSARSPRADNSLPHYRDPRYDSVKEKMLGVSNIFSFGTDFNGLYNTGFHANSTVFNSDKEISTDWTKREKKAKELYNFVMSPLKHLILDIERAKQPLDYEFFEDENLYKNFFKVDLHSQLTFNTANPKDKLALYIAIITNNICMAGQRTEDEKKLGLRDESTYGDVNTQYVYSSIKNQKTKAEKHVDAEMDATYNFGFFLKTERETLISMLNSMNLGVKNDITDTRLKAIFKTQVLNNMDNINKFNKVVSNYEENPKEFNRIAEITSRVNSVSARKAIIKEGKTWYFGDIPLGANKKSVIEKFNKDEELYQKFLNTVDN